MLMSTAPKERSLPEIARDLSSDLSHLIKSELALAKSELQENITRLGTGAGLLGGAGLIGLFSLQFLLLALTFGLAAFGLPVWASALIVAVVLGIAAAVMAMSGRKSMKGASVAPTEAIERMKTDLRIIKDDIERERSKR